MRRREGGFAMLMAIVVTTLMMVVAMVSLDLALNLKVMASAVSFSQRTMLMAEAGSKWAQGALPELIYPYGSAGPMDLSGVLQLPQLDKTDTMCQSWEDCTKYRLMTVNGPVPFGQGTYRVAVTCYPAACTLPPVSFQIRSEGVLGTTMRSVLEVDYSF